VTGRGSIAVKLDENVPVALGDSLRRVGIDVATAVERGLADTDDDRLWTIAGAEDRVLVTLDKAFADLRRPPPAQDAGVVVVRPRRETVASVRVAIDRVIARIERLRPSSLRSEVWIASEHAVRIRTPATG